MLFQPNEKVCEPDVATRVLHSFFTNLPSNFTIEVDPPDVTGAWLERRSLFPGGFRLQGRNRGPIEPKLHFRRRSLDSSYDVWLTTNQLATVTITRGKR